MNDGILSQEEIDALLKTDSNATEDEPIQTSTVISDFEKDTIGEIGNISMGTAATTLSTLLRKKVSITTPNVSVTTPQQFQSDYPLPYLVIRVKYMEGISGTNVLVVREEDACVIADLMMGGDGTDVDPNLDDLRLSAVSEAMNQMMGSATTSLSSMFNKRIDIGPPEVNLIDLGEQDLEVDTSYQELVRIKFKMVIENLIDSEIMQVLPIESVREMIDILTGTSDTSDIEDIMETPSTAPPAPEPEPTYEQPLPASSAPQYAPPAQERFEQYAAMEPGGRKGGPFSVQSVQFAPLQPTVSSSLPQNIGLILDVPLDVSVELGKTRKTIKDVLELSQGSIIQLDKLAGEPVDLMVNGKLIAKGEVVVIDENYGIRITTILSPMDRMNKLQ
ncbi:Surface presentation of antigen (SpoA) [Syntrophomonas zehnderi OL-4]|uniref:Surface presentation of antigen (SpoA) n=1 Tax=Syntrophomonas zehnderi OL-4 TaxID=690567 RepID=A0A0E3W398_9FIRM|nr:flagellar motor switch phosphatase FliY [Syntrophomonas zehnderi]CFX65314.1 Surface presentation of antigen (SpoA) [Syntrophomonas zehnderi OL-4]